MASNKANDGITNSKPAATTPITPNAGRKETVLDLTKYINQMVRVKFNGGREVHGVLKGFDPLVNLVLDECKEYIRDPQDIYRLTDETRNVGLVICRGTTVMLISPVDGAEEISNPFFQNESE